MQMTEEQIQIVADVADDLALAREEAAQLREHVAELHQEIARLTQQLHVMLLEVDPTEQLSR